MSLPLSLLQHVESHPCFTGCYSTESEVSACLDPARPLAPLIVVSCQDCFARVAVPRTMLPSSANTTWLSGHLTQHMRTLRGYNLSFSGYHARGPGFWMSGVYVASCGIFLLNGDRSRSQGSDLDLLLLSFQNGVVSPPHVAMIDPKQYALQEIYVRFDGPGPVFGSKAQLLASPCCKTQSTAGYQRVTLAEFLPVSGNTKPPPNPRSAPASTATRPLKLGDRCPTCGALVKARPLLNGTYVGCLC